MARHKVEISGLDTSKIKVLKNDEMNELFKKYRNGNLEAKENLINGNLKLVLSLLKNYNNRCDNMDDLFQVGCVGLIKAIDNFDLSYELKFSTYAVPMILGEIKRYLRDNNAIRISRSVKDIAYKIMHKKEELINEFGKEPPLDMIAKELNIPIEDINNAINSMKETISIFDPIYNDGGDTIYLEDQLPDTKNKIDYETLLSLREALEQLKQKEKHIIIERYFIGKTQTELSEELGISQAQISRLEKNGLESVKKMII